MRPVALAEQLLDVAGGEAAYPLPVNYRAQTTWVWRDNPRQLQSHPGADGSERSAATDFLAAYWLGRHLGFIRPED